MAALDGFGNLGTAANTTALQRWVYAMNDYLINGNGTPKQLFDLWKAAGQPQGSSFSQWATFLSLVGERERSTELARLLEQKLPAVGGEWVDEVNENLRDIV